MVSDTIGRLQDEAVHTGISGEGIAASQLDLTRSKQGTSRVAGFVVEGFCRCHRVWKKLGGASDGGHSHWR